MEEACTASVLRVFGDNVLFMLNSLKIYKVSPGAGQRCSNGFQSANCASSAMSPGDACEPVFHKVKKNK